MFIYPKGTNCCNDTLVRYNLIYSKKSCNTKINFLLLFKSCGCGSVGNSLRPPPAPASPRRRWFSLRWRLSDRWTEQRTLSESGEAGRAQGGGGQMLADLLIQAPVCAACPSCEHPVVSGFHRLDQSASHPSEEPPHFFCKPEQRQRGHAAVTTRCPPPLPL